MIQIPIPRRDIVLSVRDDSYAAYGEGCVYVSNKEYSFVAEWEFDFVLSRVALSMAHAVIASLIPETVVKIIGLNQPDGAPARGLVTRATCHPLICGPADNPDIPLEWGEISGRIKGVGPLKIVDENGTDFVIGPDRTVSVNPQLRAP